MKNYCTIIAIIGIQVKKSNFITPIFLLDLSTFFLLLVRITVNTRLYTLRNTIYKLVYREKNIKIYNSRFFNLT